ncbi:MAG: flagellar brake protein [Candidatus Scalindua sp.]|nr:flagellar brake protein [Candidatus Scalindua sp.]
MNIGTLLGIQVKGVGAQLTTELVGMEEGKYLILKMPPLSELGLTASILYRGNESTVKYRHKGTVFGFSSHILGVTTDPVQLIFLDYPTKFENFGLRRNERVACNLPAQVKVSGNLIEGAITDISNSGCHFVAKTSKIAYCIKSVEKNELVTIFKLPGVKKELTIPSIQKNISINESDTGIGIEFITMDIDTKAILSGFLLKNE